MCGALARLYHALVADLAHGPDPLLPPSGLPLWVRAPGFGPAVAQCDVALCGAGGIADATELIRVLRRATNAVLRVVATGRDDNVPTWTSSPRHADTQAADSCAQTLAATARLCFGELLEAHAAKRALRVRATAAPPPPPPQPTSPTLPLPPRLRRQRREFAQLCHDSYLAAVWTSAHAEYLVTVEDMCNAHCAALVLEIGPHRKTRLVDSLAIPTPELHWVACASNMFDMSALYERVDCPRACSKDVRALLAVLARAVAPGNRGWETALNVALKASDGTGRLVAHGLGVALCGLHPCVHPAARRPWRLRLATGQYWEACGASAVRSVADCCPVTIKNVVRLHLAMMLVEDLATLESGTVLRRPVAQLAIPPYTEASGAMQSCMHALAAVGELVGTGDSRSVATLAEILLAPRTRQSERTGTNEALATNLVLLNSCVSTSSARRRRRQRDHPCPGLAHKEVGRHEVAEAEGGTQRTAVATISSLLETSFRTEFVPFWTHARSCGVRVSRLDPVQRGVLHGQNSVHRLCSLLPITERFRVQRRALRVPSAPLLVVREAAALLGIRMRPDTTSDDSGAQAPCRLAGDEAMALLLSLDACSAARLIVFAQVGALRAQLPAYDLGPRTRAAQASALCRRLRIVLAPGESAIDAATQRLPAHATNLYICNECRRVVNAHQPTSGKDASFNELGLVSAMLRVEGDVCDGVLRCSKRSSASLRAAVSLERAASCLEVESLPLDREACVPCDLRFTSAATTVTNAPSNVASAVDGSNTNAVSAEVARMRRDFRSCQGQVESAVVCGDAPLVKVPILGRAIRVFNEWYAVCAWCGGITRVVSESRMGGEICCMHCDVGVLHGKSAAAQVETSDPKPSLPACRFCEKVQPESATSKWKMVAAPADTGGANACVPPPLRVAWYCPAHWRPWLETAHQSMPTSAIFAHILSKAKPMIGADGGQGGSGRDDEMAQRRANTAPRPKPRSRAIKAIDKQLNRNRRTRRERATLGPAQTRAY